jgi:hypothetical protein
MTTSPNSADDDSEFEIDLDGVKDKDNMRASSRQETSLKGVVDFGKGKMPVRIDDLSVEGAGVTTATRLPEGQDLKLTIQLSVCGSDYELEIKSRVRYSNSIPGGSYESGLRFFEMSPQTRDTLTLLVPSAKQ